MWAKRKFLHIYLNKCVVNTHHPRSQVIKAHTHSNTIRNNLGWEWVGVAGDGWCWLVMAGAGWGWHGLNLGFFGLPKLCESLRCLLCKNAFFEQIVGGATLVGFHAIAPVS